MIVDDTCFHDLSLCKRAQREVRWPGASSPAAAPEPRQAIVVPEPDARATRPPPSLSRIDERAIGMTREQLEMRSPSALSAKTTSEPRAGAAQPDVAFTRCIERSIRSGNALGESSRVCAALHPDPATPVSATTE